LVTGASSSLDTYWVAL